MDRRRVTDEIRAEEGKCILIPVTNVVNASRVEIPDG
jgi:hypothetical protein